MLACARRLVDRLLPRVCQACDAPSISTICQDCLAQSFLLTSAAWRGIPQQIESKQRRRAGFCPDCGEPMPPAFNGSRCLVCEITPLRISELRSLFWFDGPVESAIKRMKYAGRWAIAAELGRLLGLAAINPGLLAPYSGSGWDVIAAVPSPVSSLRRRSFSHTHLAAAALAKILNLHVAYDLIRSNENHLPQAGLAPRQRRENAATAFELGQNNSVIRGAKILLIDDIVTTGATIDACADQLLRSGAARVDALTVARSRRFRNHRLKCRPRQTEHNPAIVLTGGGGI